MTTTSLDTSHQVDMTGLSLAVDDVVATSLYLGGNALSGTELGFVDGVTAGTAAASKALVLNSSLGIATITSATITTLTSTTVNSTTLNAGADASAGTVNVFPTTTATGKIIISAASSAGAFNTTITNASQAASRTYTIPDAGGAASFVMTAGAQTLAGVKTFSSMPVWPVATVAATGTNLATAAQLTAGITTVTAADDTVGVKLPATPAAGTVCFIKSTVSNKILKVYPDASATINAIAANAAISLASGPTPAIFVATSTTQWYTFPLLPS